MIRPFRDDDMEQVLQVWLDASIQAHDFIDAGFWQDRLDSMRDVYLPGSTTRVFEHDGIVCGFHSLHGDALAALFVAPAWQGMGIGSELLAEAKTLRGMLELAVYSSNQAARRFYARHGFIVVGEGLDPHTGHLETRMRWSGACGTAY